ncbi:uncharacterized protein Tco025E_06898 [Trypanosoma conorhini]|uniref:Uncharacterized protein n=1 Tax=Trypanosoma conorhini TaxID=83891 RepID=A0A422NWJ1_9TRYP|nr:uncharacterized protein Tco025E_06898 [Trypanosoma conorhini]RNF09883.1 hypothetical protein Tco025E_06898 [Trypanosoma conorhini]
MSLTNYMASLMSEAQQLGKAYVDSLVAPGEQKDHDAPGGRATATVATVTPIFASTHKTHGDSATAEHRRNLDSSTTSSAHSAHHRGVAAAARDKAHDVRPQHASAEISGQLCGHLLRPVEAAAERPSSSASSSGPVEAVAVASLRRHAVKKAGRAPRSRFGAVKIQPEPATAAIATSAPVGAPPRQSRGENTGSSSLPEEKHATVVAVAASRAASPSCRRRRQQSILQQLHASLEQRAAPAGAGWAKDALAHFATKVAVKALTPAATATAPSTSSVPSSSVELPSAEAWRQTEVELRRSVRRAIPCEVFGPYSSAHDSATAVDALVPPGNVVYSNGRCVITLQQALRESLATARCWCDEHLTRPTTLPLLPSSSSSVAECGVSAFLAQCFTPLLRTGVGQVHDGAPRPPPLPEQRLQLERTALDAWAKAAMELFCEKFLAAEAAELGRPTPADARVSPSVCLDAVESAMRDGTAALWLMREAMVLTLLLLCALQSCAS